MVIEEQKTKITIEYARKKLGSTGEKMTDKQIAQLLGVLRFLSIKTIDAVTNKDNI